MVEAQQHGGLRPAELRALGLDGETLLDFSASIASEPPAPEVIAAIRSADVHNYPDPDCLLLREALAELHGVPASHVLAGNGASEIIRLAVAAFCRNGQAAQCGPTFGEFAQACTAWQVEPVTIAAEADLRWSASAVPACEVLYLCNPNNPTGIYLAENDVRALHAAACGLLLLDEAYAPFVENAWSSTALVGDGNCIVVRSLTKEHGIAGVRLGYALAVPALIERMRRLQPTWSIGSLAQAAGLAAVRKNDLALARRTASRRRDLAAALRDLQLQVIEGAANFVLVEVGDATAMRLALLRHGIAVRDCTSFDMPGWIRVAVRTPCDHAVLLAALTSLLDGEP